MAVARIRIGFLSVLLILFSACGGGGSSGPGQSSNQNQAPSPEPAITVSGIVSKGPVSGAVGIAFEADGITELGRTSQPTSADGSYAIEIGSYRGVVILEFTGGTYLDEATSITRDLGRMRSVVNVVSQTSDHEAHVTPLTEAVLQVLENREALLTAATVDASNQIRFGDSVLDITAVRPTDLRSAPFNINRDADLYGLILAALAQMEADDPTVTTWSELIPQLQQSLGDSDTGDMAENLVDAIAALRDSSTSLARRLPADVAEQLGRRLQLPSALNERSAGKLGAGVLELLWMSAQFDDELRYGVDQSVSEGSSTRPCDGGGQIDRHVNDDRSRLHEAYRNCRGEHPGFRGNPGEEFFAGISGEWEVAYNRRSSATGYEATATISDITFDYTDGTWATVDGTVEVYGTSNDFDGNVRMIYNLSVSHSVNGNLRYRGIDVQFVHEGYDFFNNLVGTTSLSGTIDHDTHGLASLSFDPDQNRIILSGRDGTRAQINTGLDGLNVSLVDSSDRPLASHSYFRDSLIATDIFADRQSPPRVTRTSVDAFNASEEAIDGEIVDVRLNWSFFDDDAELLTTDLTLLGVEMRQDVYDDEWGSTYEPDDPAVIVQIDRLAPDRFTVSSDMAGSRKTFIFQISATDFAGTTTSFEDSLEIYTDTDGDGLVDYIRDQDDDNDGVLDVIDAFRLDPQESVDTDNDGIGNNADPDDDNDGVADIEDDYPLDNRCSLASDGDGEECRTRTLDSSSIVFLGGDGISYIQPRAPAEPVLARFDTDNQTFLEDQPVNTSLYSASPGNLGFTLVEAHNAIYVTHDTYGVSRIDLGTGDETAFVTVTSDPASIGGIGLGDYFILREQAAPGMRYTAYDSSGTQVAQRLETLDPLFDPIIGWYMHPNQANYCDEGFYFDTDSLSFVDFDNPSGMDCRTFGRPEASPDGQQALTAQGEVIDPSGNVLWTLPPGAELLRWEPTELVYVTLDAVTVTDVNGTQLATVPRPSGTQISLISNGDRVVIVYRYTGLGEGLSITPLRP